MKYAIAASRRLIGLVKQLLVAATLALVPAAAHADATNLCVPSLGVWLGLWPVVDGVVGSFNAPIDNDLGWNNATQVNLSANGATRTGMMQLGRSATDLYISFSIGAPNPGKDNTIVLAFATTANASQDWRIHVTPFDNPTVAVNGTDKIPFSVQYWRDSGSWNGGAQIASTMLDPPRVKYSRSGGTGANSGYWEIEILIPIETNAANAGGNSKIYFPATGTFQFYANVISTQALTGTFTQDPWPAATQISAPGANKLLEANTPAKTGWGTLSFDTRAVCNDVKIEWSDVGVEDPTSAGTIISNIRAVSDADLNTAGIMTQGQCNPLANNHMWPGTKGKQNTFIARPHNNMSIPANKVSAKFYVANWGIPGAPPTDWSAIGELKAPTPAAVANNPTAAANIPSGFTTDLKATWDMSVAQSCTYRFSNSGHHCIQVELESDDKDVVFTTKSVQRNMDFVSASVNVREAELSVRGRGKVPPGRSQHELLLFVDTEVQVYTRGPIEDSKTKDANKGIRYYRTAPIVKQCPQGLRYPEFRTVAASNYPQGMTEALVHNVRGYLRTDCTLVINGRSYGCTKAVGSFGTFAGHSGLVNNWRAWIEGNSVRMLENGVYSVAVPEEGSVKAKITITAAAGKDKDPGPQKPTPTKGGGEKKGAPPFR